MYRVFIHMVKSTNSLAFIGWTHCHELKEYEGCWFYVRKEIITSPNSKVCCFGLFLLNSHLHNNGNVLCIKAGLYHYFVHVAQMFYIYSFVKVKVDNRLLNAEDMIVQTLYSILMLLLIMNRRVPQLVTRGERLESCVEKDTYIVHVCGHGVARLCTERIDVRSSKRKNKKQVARKKKH